MTKTPKLLEVLNLSEIPGIPCYWSLDIALTSEELPDSDAGGESNIGSLTSKLQFSHSFTTTCKAMMFETICALPLSSELFTQAIHPNEPIIAVGLSGGHVQSFRLPAAALNSDDEDGNASVLSTGTGTIETEWRTRRHKGSCRCLGFSLDGECTSQSPSALVLN